MHIADLSVGVYGANGIVGAGLPIANGIAAAFAILGSDNVVVAFFGEGAAAQGAFHEAVNLAVMWRLRVLFLCENNRFAEFSRLEQQQPVAPHERASAYRLPAVTVDGNDVLAVAEAVDAAVAALRRAEGPRMIEAVTLRGRGHYEGDAQRYRSIEEQSAWRTADPLARTALQIAELGGQEWLASMDKEVDEEIESAVAAARNAPAPDPRSLQDFVFASIKPAAVAERIADGEEYRYVDAIREALADALEADRTVWVAGIDVAAGEGVFTVTRGLAKRFPDRVRDTPISETAIMGLAVGGALAGTRPVVELMYLDFIGVCLDQVLNQAAKVRFMTGGVAPTSLVIRTQFAAGRSSGAQHSQSLESILTQIPGLKVVMPCEPADAYGLLRAAIEDPDPVVFIENRLLYGRTGPRPQTGHRVPIGKAVVRRPGRDVTVVTWSRIVHDALVAAERAAEHGIELEVIDLRTVAPIDHATIAQSVKRTGRLLIVHEAVLTTGVGAEIAAWASSELFWDLDAPVERVAPPFTPVPYAPSLEQAWLPGPEQIVNAAMRLRGA
jgi:2-oxoisovalerate dehydrogenase E1 component